MKPVIIEEHQIKDMRDVLPKAEPSEIQELSKLNKSNMKKELRPVKIDSLVDTNKEPVDYKKLWGHFIGKYGNTPPIDVIRHKNKLYIDDGHKRAISKLLKGKKVIMANVYS